MKAWMEYSREELLSMQGIEVEDYTRVDPVDFDPTVWEEEEVKEDEDEEEQCCGSACFKCSGMSWSDFL